jgi:hypothetical protein
MNFQHRPWTNSSELADRPLGFASRQHLLLRLVHTAAM